MQAYGYPIASQAEPARQVFYQWRFTLKELNRELPERLVLLDKKKGGKLKK